MEPGGDFGYGVAVVDDEAGYFQSVPGRECCVRVDHRRTPVWLGWIRALPNSTLEVFVMWSDRIDSTNVSGQYTSAPSSAPNGDFSIKRVRPYQRFHW